MQRTSSFILVAALSLLSCRDLGAQSSRMTDAVNEIGSKPLVVNAPEGPTPVMEESLEVERLKGLAPVRIPVQQATLAVAINVIASAAGMNFIAPPADQFPEIVTISVQVNPYRLLGILAKQYRFSMIFDNGVWKFSREGVGTLVARTFRLRHTNLDTFKARQNSFGGSSDNLESGSSSNSGSDSGSSSGGDTTEAGGQVFDINTQKIIDDIRELVGLPSTATRALIAREGEMLPKDEGRMPVLVVRDKENGARVIYLANTNSIYVVATLQQMDYVQAYLEEVDKPERQVRIVARFLETTHEPSRILGVNWENAQPDVTLANINNAVDIRGVPNSSFADNALLSVSNLTWQLRALEQDSDTNLVNNPTVVTANNREVYLSVGTEEPFVDNETAQGGVEGSFGATRTKVKFRRIGTTVNVTPTIFDGEGTAPIIRLFVQIEVGALTGFREIGGNQVPVVASQRYLYTVFVPEGYTLAFGGLAGMRETVGKKAVPVLGKVPGVGYLFKSSEHTKQQRNLIAYITPTVFRAEDYLVPLKSGDLSLEPPAPLNTPAPATPAASVEAKPEPAKKTEAVSNDTAGSNWRTANKK